MGLEGEGGTCHCTLLLLSMKTIMCNAKTNLIFDDLAQLNTKIISKIN